MKGKRSKEKGNRKGEREERTEGREQKLRRYEGEKVQGTRIKEIGKRIEKRGREKAERQRTDDGGEKTISLFPGRDVFLKRFLCGPYFHHPAHRWLLLSCVYPEYGFDLLSPLNPWEDCPFLWEV